MAKRSYRGKHPYNDAKVETASSTKYSSKLTTEYNKLKDDKQKYDYIRTHYFHPQASCTISASADLATASQITMSDAHGKVLMIGGASATNVGNKVFKANGTDAQASTGIRDIVNANLDVQITASLSSNVITLTSLAPGPDGNKNLTMVSVPSKVTINGTTAQSSGSGLGLTGG
jgi:hypothetical protein